MQVGFLCALPLMISLISQFDRIVLTIIKLTRGRLTCTNAILKGFWGLILLASYRLHRNYGLKFEAADSIALSIPSVTASFAVLKTNGQATVYDHLNNQTKQFSLLPDFDSKTSYQSRKLCLHTRLYMLNFHFEKFSSYFFIQRIFIPNSKGD